MNINELTSLCHNNAKSSGWWTGPNGEDLLDNGHWSDYVIATKLALIHSETSEALEGHRRGMMDDKLTEHSMLSVELADIVIRVLDLAGALNINMGDIIDKKLDFNTSREDHKPKNRYKPGGKKY